MVEYDEHGKQALDPFCLLLRHAGAPRSLDWFYDMYDLTEVISKYIGVYQNLYMNGIFSSWLKKWKR
jgi:hypothetical protein